MLRRFINQLINNSDNPNHINNVKWMWRIVLGGISAILLLFIGLSFTNLPSVKELENPRSEEASQIFSANGEVLGRYYTENRVPVSFDELSPQLVKALIATEDVRYYKHCGIDFQALGRVFVKTFLMGNSSSGGASTITQQLAKLLFTGKRATNMPKRVVQKLKEWIIAVRLERRYTKEEIIALYLNKFEFINGAYGIKAASEIYFDKAQDSLEIQEAAMLIGMLKNPSLYNPLRRPERVLQRRAVVLKQMQKNGFLSRERYEALKDLPLGLNYSRQSHIDGLAPYFRMELGKDLKNILSRPECRKSDGSEYNIYRDGLRIYTTIDIDMQRIAEEEMIKNMKRVQKTFWNVWRNMDPWKYQSDSPTETSLEVRQQTLSRLVRESDRYQALRAQYLSNTLAEISREFEIDFSEDDHEVEYMVKEDESPGLLSKLVARKMITSSMAVRFREVIDSPYFTTLRTRWDELQTEARKAFNRKVKMQVFTYDNTRMEKDTTMTPLDSIKYHRMFLQTGILAVDPSTGYIKVWVGGINHKYFQYDHIRTRRQVGSTFKPFVYATAIAMQGFSPCYQVYDLPVTIGPGDGQFNLIQEWKPSNADGIYTGNLITLKEGLSKSKNTVSAHLMKQLGSTAPVRDLINEMGIDKNARYANGRLVVPDQPSICLGAADLTVYEMAGAYTTFANNGVFNKPTAILRVEDKNGRVIYQSLPEERTALNPKPNYVMMEMLKYAVSGMGGLNSEVGGKTGTTNDYVDGWFMGVTPKLVVGTWVGGEDRWFRFRNLLYGQGAYMAKPFFREFIKRLENEKNIDYDSAARFYRPPGDLEIEMNCNEYKKNTMPLEDEFGAGEQFQEDIFGDENIDQQEDQ